MASSISIELGEDLAGAGAGGSHYGHAHGSHSHSKKRASRSHGSSGGGQVAAGAHERNASASLSRVRVHVSASPDEQGDEERKSPMPALGSAVSGGSSVRGDAANLATPTGAVAGFAEEDDSEASGALKADSDRSRKAVALLRELDSWLLSEDVIATKSKATRQFYAEQNELVEGYKGIVRLEEAETAAEKEAADAATEKQSGLVKFAIEASLANTFLLIVMKFVAAIWSGSISIIASAVDSALDVLSQSTLVVTSRFMHRKDPVRFPIGKSRVENLAVLVFSVIMGLAALFLLYQSLLVLVDGLHNQPEIRVDAVTTTILAASIVIQIFAHFFCKWVASKGGKGATAVQAVAEDHANDVCANSLAMAAALIAGHEPVAWFSDPIGGILISLYILFRWVGTCHEQFMLLLGQSAERDFLCRLTYLAANFDERILKVDTVIAYRLGAKCHAEVHVVLPADMPLRVAHDIGEALEQNIEKIEDIELAWVHLDFEWSHSAEHRRWDL